MVNMTEYIYLPMVSGWEETQVLGAFDNKEIALKKAKNYLKKHRHCEDCKTAYALKIKVNSTEKEVII